MNLIDDTDVNYNKKKNNTKKIMVTIIMDVLFTKPNVKSINRW